MRADTVYVRTRDLSRLRLAVDLIGNQSGLARTIGTSKARMSQIMHGTTQTVPVAMAVAIEDALAVPRGTLFCLPDPELARHYLDAAA